MTGLCLCAAAASSRRLHVCDSRTGISLGGSSALMPGSCSAALWCGGQVPSGSRALEGKSARVSTALRSIA